jgi:hypothetical protein
MNRHARRAKAALMRQQAAEWPERLVEIPEAQWPPSPPGHARPIQLWRSRHYLLQVFAQEPYQGSAARRLSVCRTTIQTDGDWQQDIPWVALQRCKREAGFGDWYGFEIYPRDRDVVDVANMRHLWLLAEPLPIGWFQKE